MKDMELHEEKKVIVNTGELQALMEHGLLSLQERGALLALTRFLSLDTNILVRREGEPLVLKDIAEICGLSQRSTESLLDGLIEKELLASVECGEYEPFYLLNPWIAVRTTSVDATLLTVFGEYRVLEYGGKTLEQLFDGQYTHHPA